MSINQAHPNHWLIFA